MNGAEILVQALLNEGVTDVFGYPGGALLEIFDALADSPINNILVRQEQGAVHEASGYARAKNTVGVCIATSGPGATNMVTGIATAQIDSIPVVAITGNVAKHLIGTDAFQEIDITGISTPITKHNVLVKNAEDLPQIIAEAFYIAKSGRPGPVLIDIPRDVSQQKVEAFEPWRQVDIRSYKPTIYGHAGMIKRAAKKIIEAERLVIIAGGGVNTSGAGEDVLALAKAKNCPIVCTMMGLGSVPSSEPHVVGMLGTYGNQEANTLVRQADVILAIGTRFDDRIINAPNLFAPNSFIIHVDVDPAEIGKNIQPDIPIVGDAKHVMAQLAEAVQRNDEKMVGCGYLEKPHLPVVPDRIVPKVLDALSKLVDPEKSFYTTDVGQHQVWAANYLKCERPHQFISSCGLGTMGYGVPAAVGAQVACPDSTVVVITGDGSFQMGMYELGTIMEQDLPVKILLFNNHTLGMVRQLQYHYVGKRYSNVKFGCAIDFSKIFEAYGFNTYRINSEDEIEDALKAALADPKCALIECVVPMEDNCSPITLAGANIDDMVEC
ncbi:MAG: biosynthetic-type acetolactate synthase large subunit [Peptococcaceae bacterium]|nr:biosynthetic-type acetolactate synthase large subunit [Peptococcaceae bacterium]